MQVPIGEMREPVSILTPVRTTDASGGEVISYTESEPHFVSIRALSTAEAVQFDQINASISHVCFGHYEPLSQLDAKMQAHMQERIRLATIGRVIFVELIAANVIVVFRVPLDDRSDLRLQRRQRRLVALFFPGVRIHLPEFISVLSENHASTFFLYSHHSMIEHSPQSGVRALQT